MKIEIKKPPNYQELSIAFNLRKGTVFTWLDTLYNPDDMAIPPWLLAHEIVHANQQRSYGVERWWARYMTSEAFRLSQEIPAYQMEFKVYKKSTKDRNKVVIAHNRLAETLSSDLYGNIISKQEALEAIERKRLFAFRV